MRKWALYLEKDGNGERWCIRAGNKRLPRVQYRHIETDENELRQFVTRLNAPITGKAAVEIRHAFIDDALIEAYIKEREVQLGSETPAQVERMRLRTYFLGYFIARLNLPNPLDWHRIHKTQWAEYLLSREVPGSVSTKRAIVQIANRFMLWLHERRPAEVPPLKFDPLSKTVLKQVHAKRELEGSIRERRFIPDQDWVTLAREMPKELVPYAYLGYWYGLRRSETLGIKPQDVRTGYLSVERQKTNSRHYAPLKGRDKRKVPHWFGAAEACAEYASRVDTKLYPDALTEAWRTLTKNLKEAGKIAHDYDFHDLRHTWVTKAMRCQVPVDVMRAAGHVNIETTMGYLHDDRELDSAVVLPKGA